MQHPVIRPSDRCLVTGQPIYCPECGSPLGKRGECTDTSERCRFFIEGEYHSVIPYPDYQNRRKQ